MLHNEPLQDGEVSGKNAQRMIALALLRLDEDRKVRQPWDQRGQRRRALVDNEGDPLVKVALIERSRKAEQGMCPNSQLARKAARKVHTNRFAQLGMRADEGLDRPIADREKRTRAGMNEGIDPWATILGLHAS
jgi:hypothetical protein